MSLLRQLSDLGDTASAVASACVITVWCWRGVNRLSAAVFLVSLAGLMAALVALKLVAAAYEAPPDLTSTFSFSTGAPSGHAALASFVYGAAALLCRRTGRGAAALAAPLLFLSLIGVVAVTRVTLGFHTAPDVLAGLAVGSLPLIGFDRVLRVQAVRRTASIPALLVGLGVVAVAIAAAGVRLPSTMLL